MNQDDLKQIKSIVDSALETHLGSVHEEITDMRNDVTKLEETVDGLGAKIDRIDAKLGAFENHEVDKRMQLEVRVTHIEKHLGIPKSRA
jgi:septal ring factor EnvC (AmiA/AmiB activator)